MRGIGIVTLLLIAACSKTSEQTSDAAHKTPATIAVPEKISFAAPYPADDIALPAPDPAIRAASRAAYVEFAGQLNVNAFLEIYPGIARSLRSGTREECLNAVRICGASRDLRAIPLLVHELAYSAREQQHAAGMALEELVNNHELKRRDFTREGDLYMLPRKEGTVDLRPMYWVLEEMLRSGDSGLQGRAAMMAGYLGLDSLAPLLRPLRASRHPALTNAIDASLEQLELNSAR